MKFVLDSEHNYSVKISLSKGDAQKTNIDIIGDLSILCLCAVKTFVRENFAFDGVVEEKEIVSVILAAITRLAEAYYYENSTDS